MSKQVDKSTHVAGQVLNFVKERLDNYFLKQNNLLMQNRDNIDRCLEFMSDNESKQKYINEIAFIAARKISPEFGEILNPFPKCKWDEIINNAEQVLAEHHIPELKVLDPKEHMSTLMCRIETFLNKGYTYKDLVTLNQGDVFLDCGAYVGDTAIWAYQNGAKEVYSFEPCAAIIENYKLNMQAYNLPTDKVFQYAVGNSNGQMDFLSNEGGRASSFLVDDSRKQYAEMAENHVGKVDCIRLDDFCAEHNIQPNFIKMDIEGAEQDALIGSHHILKTCKPNLAICLYHKVEDMWCIPMYLKAVVPEYKFYCTKNHYLYDFILFATVK